MIRFVTSNRGKFAEAQRILGALFRQIWVTLRSRLIHWKRLCFLG